MSRREALESGIRRAIGDPNSVIGKRIDGETITVWQTRAVMKTLENKNLIKSEE